LRVMLGGVLRGYSSELKRDKISVAGSVEWKRVYRRTAGGGVRGVEGKGRGGEGGEG
jgi:hypothetical protein